MASEQRIIGPPGTGKTQYLQRQVAHLVEAGRYAPTDFVLTSYTRSAAAVLRGRIAVPDRQIATLHALAYRAIGSPPIAEKGDLARAWDEAHVRLPAWQIGPGTVDDDDGLRAPDAEQGEMLRAYSLARSSMAPHHHPLWAHTRDFALAWRAFKDETGSVDFCDMLEEAATFVPALPHPVLIVDEAQDLVPLQWELVRRWGAAAESFVVAGDPAQCQPTGTSVLVTRDKPHRFAHGRLERVPIESIVAGDQVVSCNLSGGWYVMARTVLETASRPYTGDLITIETEAGLTSRYTPSHRCVVNFTALRGKWAVYLMRRGQSFRVGRARMHYSTSRGNGVPARMRAEDADASWILSVHDSSLEAGIAEAKVIAQFGIPGIVFREVRGSTSLSSFAQPILDKIWAVAGDMTPRATRCLAAFGRELDHPLFDRANTYKTLKRPMLTAAANLMDGCKVLPFAGEVPRSDYWQSIVVRRESYSGVVYSLSIEGEQVYFADGILTHNSIYSFAGARPDEMLAPVEHQRLLSVSYRLPLAVQAHAERWLRGHSGPLTTGREYAARQEAGVVRALAASWRNPDLLVDDVERVLSGGRTAMVLASCAYMLAPTLAGLRERGIAFHNRYRSSNGAWNPLGPREHGALRTIDRLASYLRGEDAHWPEMLRANCFLFRGAKKMVEEGGEDVGELLQPEYRALYEARDPLLLLRGSLGKYARPLEYAVALTMRKEDVATTEPLLTVGTIHSVKGGEAAVVYVFPDVSVAGAEEMESNAQGQDAAVRLFYVGFTRAQQELVLCDASDRRRSAW